MRVYLCLHFSVPYIQTLIRRQSESMVNRSRINFAQSIFFSNITRRQAISPVAKWHQVLGRGFRVQRVILIFIKCLSANQNQQIYMKVYIAKNTQTDLIRSINSII